MHRILATAASLCLLATAAGCSVGGAASTGLSVFQNTKSNQLGVRIWLDGQEAKRNELKQAAAGYSRWKIKEPVSTKPKFRFDFKEPDALGRIRMIAMQIHQKFEADYSHLAEYKIFSESSDSTAQLKPNVEYDLGNIGSGYKVLDVNDKQVAGVDLRPGMQYMLVFTVSADKSESAQIYFETK